MKVPKNTYKVPKNNLITTLSTIYFWLNGLRGKFKNGSNGLLLLGHFQNLLYASVPNLAFSFLLLTWIFIDLFTDAASLAICYDLYKKFVVDHWALLETTPMAPK